MQPVVRLIRLTNSDLLAILDAAAKEHFGEFAVPNTA